ncbi:MAG: hypothetical protein JNJ89_17815 [Rubrivivax sp.]|nr:hypothetical protein [Rubrivivax sp.]
MSARCRLPLRRKVSDKALLESSAALTETSLADFCTHFGLASPQDARMTLYLPFWR